MVRLSGYREPNDPDTSITPTHRPMSIPNCALDLDTTVNDVLRCHPAAVAVFNAFGVDACCGGAAPLREAAKDAGVLPETLLFAVESVVREDTDATDATAKDGAR